MGETHEVDVLVVGGGPGGAAAAYHLAAHGVNTLVVEKARYPREKVCGDGLTPRGVRALVKMGVDPSEPGFVRVDGLRTRGQGVTLGLPWPDVDDFPPFGVVRTRNDLDHLLIQRAQKAGSALWEQAEATAPSLDEKALWVRGATVKVAGNGSGSGAKDTEERTVSARYVIAADGAASRFASQAGVRRNPKRPLGIAARRYYRSPRPQEPFLESWLDLREGDAILPGYGWIFPLGEGVLNVGAGLLNTFRDFKKISARRVFDVFVAMLPEEWGVSEETAMSPLLSGPLPMGFNRTPLARPGMLVVGDAGGIVNPFNGEGIAYAMEAGELAAELIFEALVRDRPGVAHMYPVLLRQRYGRYFSAGRAFVRAIGDPRVMRLLTRYGLPQEALMRFALRFMANITDGSKGNAEDKLMAALVRLAPED